MRRLGQIQRLNRPATFRPADAPRANGLRVVSIGGGTGLSTLLKGLKRYVYRDGDKRVRRNVPEQAGQHISELTAVVTVSDDGGSSGRLRREFNVLPPGDIRNCLLALSEDEALLSRLFRFRFPTESGKLNGNGSGLGGHSFGNLFLTALAAITGDFVEAVRHSSAILATCGRIFPATISNVDLAAELEDGSRVRGETSISACKRRIVRVELVPSDVAPLPETLAAIADADLITIGPGSLFTSLVPNLLVAGISDAIISSRALKVFVCNLMTQPTETVGLSAADHVRALHQHAGAPFFDYVLINRRLISRQLAVKYALSGSSQIRPDLRDIQEMGVRVIEGDYLVEAGTARHSCEEIARELMQLAGNYNRELAEKQRIMQAGITVEPSFAA